MNGFADHGQLDDVAFGDSKGNIVQAFDAFHAAISVSPDLLTQSLHPAKSKPQYVMRTSGGGKWTVVMLAISALLFFSEASRWYAGTEEHTYAVEKGVGHDLQINLDILVRMRCPDLHINVQDASGDRILAADKLKKDLTNWHQWTDATGVHKLGTDKEGKIITDEGWHDHEEGFGQEHVHDIIADARKKAKWSKTPRIKGNPRDGDSCRLYGSLALNKVQGDFHITARGHGYMEGGPPSHLDHSAFNFSHIISELSFGPFYPSLVNPLDRTIATTPNNFHKFQYFLSVVPTVYTLSSGRLRTVITNQYAVTENSYQINDRDIPGLFFKYDIEPLMLTIDESRESFLRFCVKIVNMLSGVLVTGHWVFTLTEWLIEVIGKRRKQRSEGVLTGKAAHYSDE